MSRPGALLALLGMAAAPAFADEPWKEYKVKDGVSYQKREVPGSKWLEYRASTSVKAPVPMVLERIWTGVTTNLPSTVKKREVLRRTDTEYLVYDQIKAPVVSDRDVTILIRKMVDPAHGGAEVRFQSTQEQGPPQADKHVRIAQVRGGWTLAPAADGSTQLTYSCYSEPGGSIPAWVARGAQQDQVILDFERILIPLRASGH